MATITGAAFDENKYRTPIVSPADDQLHGVVTVTLKEVPIGQPNFVVGQGIVVFKGPGVIRVTGEVKVVYGPTKYGIELGN